MKTNEVGLSCMYKLLEDDLKSTLHQSRKVYFNYCNGACWNLANDAEQLLGKAAYFACFYGGNAK